MFRRALVASTIAVFAAFSGCAHSDHMKKAERWVPYTGCNAAQCQSWFEECEAECVGQHDIGVTECETKCRAHTSSCESACSGP